MTLILGGVRSGKSSFAEKLAAEHGGSVLYVATAEGHDEEMAARIALHRAQRPATWMTLEAPSRTGRAIAAFKSAPDVVLVDCITLLASNAMSGLTEPCSSRSAETLVDAEIRLLLEARENSRAAWFVVSNETGLGVVPPYPLGRAYRDALGRANQTLAAAADTVLFMVAGIPMKVK
jgi:adenosylcobinamide kinase/adenosylcobinamide-phosphate guanylyltransferase